MEKFNNEPEVEEKEEKGKLKGYVTPRFVILTAAVAGAGLYLVGRSKGFNAGLKLGARVGYDRGRAEGYESGINAIGGIVKEVRNTIEGAE